MNKTELIAAVAEKAGLSKKDTEAAVNATLLTITETLKAEEKVQLVGFGSFETKKRAARTGLNALCPAGRPPAPSWPTPVRPGWPLSWTFPPRSGPEGPAGSP